MDYKNISKIYLASKSPRRQELLTLMGINFALIAIDIPEQAGPSEGFRDYSQRICCHKALAGWEQLIAQQQELLPVLSADTEVVVDGVVFGKPTDYADAWRMWQLLAARRHLVITSISLKYRGFHKTVSCESWVYFDQVNDAAIHAYLATGDYKDKAGAYAIQSFAGQFIQKIDGCFYSIMGLPLNAVRSLLLELDNSWN